jgi:histidinol-phosphate/aromatic aminotransferase/cobyric acid decarboxylase-like protein
LRNTGALDAAVDADVLDAWFPPSPGVVMALADQVARLARTSPPPNGEGLVEAIARRFGVHPRHIVLGAGSSDLVYRAMTAWLDEGSRVLVLDPSYREYAHVAQKVARCSVEWLVLPRDDDYAPSGEDVRRVIGEGYDLVVLVNPNNPTGHYVERPTLLDWLDAAPSRTRIWVDEAYAHLVEHEASLVPDATTRANLFVCRSLSKSFALSGLRVAFLAGPADDVEALRRRTPPWVVGFPGQVAALRALEDEPYYARQYADTRRLRRELAASLRRAGFDVLEGQIASVLVHLPDDAPAAAEVVARCARRGVFVRDASDMGRSLGRRVLRVAVKDGRSHARIVSALHAAAFGAQSRSP